MRLHRRIGETTGLPVIAFLLYPEAGGYLYPDDLLDRLLALTEVVGVKVATLDSPKRFQEVSTALRRRHPDKLLITGEDRFFGASLMWGAQCALVATAAACPELTVRVLHAWREQRFADFIEAGQELDDFAQIIFGDPVDGYVQRMLWAAAAEGTIRTEEAFDPLAPVLDRSEREQVFLTVPAFSCADSDRVARRQQ